MNYLELFQNDFKLIIPELFLSSSILFILVAGVLFNKENTALIKNISWLSILTLIISALLLLTLFLLFLLFSFTFMLKLLLELLELYELMFEQKFLNFL